MSNLYFYYQFSYRLRIAEWPHRIIKMLISIHRNDFMTDKKMTNWDKDEEDDDDDANDDDNAMDTDNASDSD